MEKKTTEIYIVQAEEGSYDQDITWIVCAYNEENLAETHANRANTEAECMRALSKIGVDCDNIEKLYDSEMTPETTYHVVTVTLRDALP